jgi:hypothetical protein
LLLSYYVERNTSQATLADTYNLATLEVEIRKTGDKNSLGKKFERPHLIQ